MMEKERSRLKTIVSAPLLSLAILGCLLLMAGCTSEGGPDSATPVPTPPTFQPDILDKPIINAPPGKEGAPPFLFDFDAGNSSGFEEVRADHPGAPTLILGSNASATLPIVVSSEADTGVDVRVVRTDGLPDDVCVSYVPDTFTLRIGEKARLKMHLTALDNRTMPAEAIVVWMEGVGWEVGRGFFLGLDHGEALPGMPGDWTPRPADNPGEDTPYIEIHRAGGLSVFLHPEDPGYPAIEAECGEQIRCISAQYQTGFSPEELEAMKQNGTYVAMNFPIPTTFETGYLVDGSPKVVTVNEVIIFLDLESYPEAMIITRTDDEPGVWDTSRNRRELRNLVAPIVYGL